MALTRNREEWVEVYDTILHGHIPDAGSEYFYDIGHAAIDKLKELGGLKSSVRVVEVGCGNGPAALGLTEENIKHYFGFDIIEQCIGFCSEAFEPWNNFDFQHLNIFNQRYARHNTIDPLGMWIPVGENSCDLGLAFSLFTHLGTPGICEVYLNEFRRIIKRGGLLYCSWAKVNGREKHNVNRTELREKTILDMINTCGWYVLEQHKGVSAYHKQWFLLLRNQKCHYQN